VHLSTTRFLIAQGVGFVLVTIGVILARQFSFPRMMLVILGTTVLVNGITHTVTSLTFGGYGPGLFSSVFIWIPLGGVVLVRFWKQVTRKRYWVGLAIGVGINVLIGVITERGGRLI
jgi:hypothetical protein